MAESKTYTGSCHCGANAFSISISPPLEDPKSTVINCNCTLCSKNAYLFAFVPASNVTWTKGSFEVLTAYRWNSKLFPHWFCPTCGTSLAGKGPGDQVAFNVRAFDDVDLKKLTLFKYDGRSK